MDSGAFGDGVIAGCGEAATFLVIFSDSFGGVGWIPLAVEAHDIGFELVRADFTIGSVEMAKDGEGSDVRKSNGAIAEFVNEERIERNDELCFESAFGSEEESIFGVFSLELVICFHHVVASSSGGDSRGEARIDGGNVADSSENQIVGRHL